MGAPEVNDIAERAEKIYTERLKERLEAAHMNEYVVIEPDSGDHFQGKTISEASALARAAHPGKISHLIRIGHRAAYFIGGASLGWKRR
jgi:hypothetical protein